MQVLAESWKLTSKVLFLLRARGWKASDVIFRHQWLHVANLRFLVFLADDT